MVIVNHAAMNTGVCRSFGINVLSSFFFFFAGGGGSIYLGVELLGHMVVLDFPGSTSGKEPTC